MIIETAVFIAGLILLVKGSDFFVKSAATIAKRFGVSEFVIGLTLVALGTSLPELASSVAASLKQDSGLILGNVVGSNIANIGLVIGIGAIMMRRIKTKKRILKRDGYIMLFTSMLFFAFIIDSTISRIEASVFLLLYFAYIMFLLRVKVPKREKEPFMDFIKYFFKLQYLLTVRSRIMTNVRRIRDGLNGYRNHRKKPEVTESQAKQIMNLFTASIIKDLLIIMLSGVAIYFGAKYVVEGAQAFAIALNIPSTFIGIALVAVGTSLPELSVSISAARRKYGGMVIGNILGSNIANILLILGVSAMISPLTVLKSTILFATPAMLIMSILLLGAMSSKWELTKKEGVILLAFYIAIMAFLLFTYL